MWLKLVLLIIYVSILFILARVLETITWVESGNFSRRLLDPMTLSVLKLKALLEQRGISYEGAVEKRELTELVESSGAVTDGAVLESALEESVEVTNFTGGAHFLEQVEDCKDSVWLVYVRTKRLHTFDLSDTSWYMLRRKLSRFGVNAGIFDCQLDEQFCFNKGWHSSKLILGIPQDFRKQGVVTLYSYSGSYKEQSIFNWVRKVVSTKVYTIQTLSSFQKKWVTYSNTSSNSEVRMVLFSHTDTTPLFFSALSVKFPGRVRFGKFKVDLTEKQLILRTLKSDHLPLYVVITPETMYSYGYKAGEHLTFRSVETFLKMLYPSVNDVFVLSLMVCNLISIFEPFVKQGSCAKRLVCLIWCVVKYNMTLLLIWISLLTLFQLSVFNWLIEMSLKLIRIAGGSHFGRFLQQDAQFYLNHCYLTEFTLMVYLSIVGCLAYKYKTQLADESNPNEWNFAQFRTLQHLFYPTASISASIYRSRYHDPEESRATMNLLHCSQIQEDYIKLLPSWKYKNLSPITTFGPVYPPIPGFEEHLGQRVSTTMINHDTNDSDVFHSNLSKCPSTEKISVSNTLENVTNNVTTESQTVHTSWGGPGNETVEENIELNMPSPKTESNTEGKEHDEAPEGVLLDTQCVICLDDYVTGALLCGLPCGHCFHKKCLVTWLTRDNHICPVCRHPSDQPKSTIHLHSE